MFFLYIIFPSSNVKSTDREKATSFKEKISSIKRWCISFLFDTQYIFNSPWLSTSPKEFWSFRWHTCYNDLWKELGYIPLHNYLIDSNSSSSKNENKKKLARISGTLL